MATKRISSHLILHRNVLIKNQTYLQFMMFSWVHLKFFTKLILHNFIKKRITNTYTRRCENMWLILKRDRKCQCHIWTSCRWRFAHFWFGARLNHYQYHLIWEPGCHRTSFISNSQRSSQYHGLFFIKFSKIQWSFHQTSKILNSLIWYFDFWKFMDEGNF